MLGEILPCTRELGNAHDIFAMKVTKGGVISCEITDPNRRYSRDLAQGCLEIPCKFKFQGNKQLVDEAKKLLAISKKSNEKEGTTKKVDLPSSNSPEEKQIKVEEMSPPVPEAKRIKVEDLEDEQIVWVAFTGAALL